MKRKRKYGGMVTVCITGMLLTMMMLFSGCGVLGSMTHNNTKTVTITSPDGTTVVTKYDYSNDAVYYDSAARHTEAEDSRISKTVSAVMKNSECPGCSPGEKGLSRALANVIVEHLQPNPWTVVRGTTGWDVAKSLTNGVALPLGIVTLGAVRMNEKANSQTTINGRVNKFGHSFNKTENAAVGQNTSATVTPPETTVVQPSYPPAPAAADTTTTDGSSAAGGTQ